MAGPVLLSAAVGASISLLIAFCFKSLYDWRKRTAFRPREDETWE